MDRNHCRCRCARGYTARISIRANTKTGDCGAGKTTRASSGKHGQISCCAALREPQLRQGERVFRTGYSG